MSLLELFKMGGPVMWVFLFLSVVGLVLFIERALYLHRGQIRSSEFLEGIKNIIRKRRLVEALTVAEETPGPVAGIVKAGLLQFEEPEEKIRFSIQEAALVEIPALERRVGSIAAIAQIAPLLGLLGTILGMIQTFYQFEVDGSYAAADVLSGGMWQALLTTAGGLSVGIAAHLAHHFLAGRVKALVYDMEWVGNEILQFLLSERKRHKMIDQEKNSG
ncbi:MAG: MotA/TolQ/ExbB proton channel family protein [Opitutaceae bacterium]|nr:MotA/TolQ/ExbB proton channel family protein [Opitutaceae bacterium]